MQLETEGAAVDLACSQLDQIANGWIERTAGKVTGQPEGMAVGVWIGGIGVETHYPDGRSGARRKSGMPRTTSFSTGVETAGPEQDFFGSQD